MQLLEAREARDVDEPPRHGVRAGDADDVPAFPGPRHLVYERIKNRLDERGDLARLLALISAMIASSGKPGSVFN